MSLFSKRQGLFISFVIVTALLLTTTVGCQEEEDIVAEVNGREITLSQLESRMLLFDFLMPEYAQSLEEDESFKAFVEQNLLSSMIQGHLVEQEIESLGLTIDEEELEANYHKEVGEMISEQFQTEENFHERLEELNLSESVLKDLVRESYKTKILYDHIVEGVTREDAEQFYEENQSHFMTPASVKVSHILVENEEEADEAFERIEEGEEFSEVLEDVSMDQPGEFVIVEDDPSYDQDFTRAAFELTTGEIGSPVETKFGWHIIRLHEKEDETIYGYEEVKEEVLALKQEEVFSQYFEDLYHEADIVNYLEG